jgi:hypothetical protein
LLESESAKLSTGKFAMSTPSTTQRWSPPGRQLPLKDRGQEVIVRESN